MALTRPTFQNLNSNLTTFTDSLTVTNFGNIANRDIGEVFDRSQGGGSNVAVFWQEATQSFRLAYTSSNGLTPGNLTVTANANLIVGNLTATTLTVTNISYINQETVTSSDVIQGNLTANVLTVNNSANIGSTLGVTGNITAGNISATYFVGNGSQLTGLPASFGNSNVAAYLPTYSGSLGGTLTTNAQPNITSTGTLTGLTLSGTLTGTTINAGTFGNNGANFVGTVFSASGSFAGPLTGTLGATGAANTAIVSTLTTTGTATVNALVSNGAIQGTTIGGSGTATFASVVSNGAIQGTTIGGSGNATVSALTVNGSATIGTTLGVTGNITAGNISATYFVGNGSQLTGLPASFGNSNVAAYLPTYGGLLGGTLTTASQPNVTSVGTLTSLTTSGNVTAAGIVSNANITATATLIAANIRTVGASGNITGANYIVANYFSGDGSLLTNISSSYGNANVAAYLPIYSGNLVSLTGNVTTTANITGGNLLTGGVISSAGNATVSALTVNNSATIGTTLGVAGVTRITDTTQGGSGAGALIVSGGGSFGKDLYVTGNLYAANLIAVTTSNLSIQDPLLYLTANSVYPYNYSIGFYSQYQGGNPGNVSANIYQHTGVVRDSSDLTWKLFSNVVAEPGVTVNFTNAQWDQLKAGNTSVVGTLSSTGNLTANAITINNSATIGTTLGVTGNVTIGGNLTVVSNVAVTGTTTFTGNILGNTTHSANVIAAGFFFANGAAVGTGGGGGSSLTYTVSTTTPISPRVGDQWYNSTLDVLYEYQNVGTANVWIDTSGPSLPGPNPVSTNPDSLSPFLLMGA